MRNLISEHKKSGSKIKPHLLIRFFDDLINGLSFLQINGICHRDLKPLNIMLDESKQNLKIIDYGSAKHFHIKRMQLEETKKLAETKINLTIVGTEIYFSPELMNGYFMNQNDDDDESTKLKYNPFKSDAFSFGLLFLELWLLKRIDNKLNKVELKEEIEKHLSELKLSIDEDNFEKSIMVKFNKMIKILRKSLEIEPADRWDFIEMFKQNIDLNDNKKLRFHMKIESCHNEKEIKVFLENCNFCHKYIN